MALWWLLQLSQQQTGWALQHWPQMMLQQQQQQQQPPLGEARQTCAAGRAECHWLLLL
jgi:hypothetical protein